MCREMLLKAFSNRMKSISLISESISAGAIVNLEDFIAKLDSTERSSEWVFIIFNFFII